MILTGEIGQLVARVETLQRVCVVGVAGFFAAILGADRSGNVTRPTSEQRTRQRGRSDVFLVVDNFAAGNRLNDIGRSPWIDRVSAEDVQRNTTRGPRGRIATDYVDAQDVARPNPNRPASSRRSPTRWSRSATGRRSRRGPCPG